MKKKTGGQPRNKNAQRYAAPMRVSKAFRVTAAQDRAYREQCEAKGVEQSEPLREFFLRFAGVVE